jgi:hypothetical protein
MVGALGGVPATVAVSITWPAATSAGVIVWLAVQVRVAPAARGVVGQLTVLMMGSVTAMSVMVTLPVFVTAKANGMMSPTAVAPGPADLTIDSVGVWTAAMSTAFEATGVSGVPVGGVPLTAAVLTTWPASRSWAATL